MPCVRWTAFGTFANYACTWDRWIKTPWACWPWPMVGKTGGMWYSTTKAGWCGAPGADPRWCTWDAVVEKVVNKSCSDSIIYDAIEAWDKTQVEGCFSKCPAHRFHPFKPRNTSDTCWIYCTYATILGPSRLLPSGGELAGMPLAQITEAFERPFKPESEGGCPDIKPPTATILEAARRRYAPPTTSSRSKVAMTVRAAPSRMYRVREAITASMFRELEDV